MRVAFFAPLSPMRGGVVDYSEEILPHLARYCQIDLFTQEGITPDNPILVKQFPIYRHSEFLKRDRRVPYDQVIYQLGCSGDHLPDYENLMKRPGLVVLHELNLSGIIGAQTFGRGRPGDYLKAVLYNEGIMAAGSVIWRFARTRSFPDYLAYDFNRRALFRSQGVIVHNRYMQRNISERLGRWRLRRPVYQVPMGVRPLHLTDTTEPHQARQKLDLCQEAFILGSFGVVHESKGILTALRAFKRLLERVPSAFYLLVGPVETASLYETIQTLGLNDRVRVTGYVEMDTFYCYMAATDLCLNLRFPRTGGTSAALLRLLSIGRPVIISNQAQFAEIPDDICLKTDCGDCAEDSILKAMLDMATNPEKARQIGERSRRFVVQAHSLEKSAHGYWAAIQHSLKSAN